MINGQGQATRGYSGKRGGPKRETRKPFFIPSKLSDLESDDEHMLVTLDEKEELSKSVESAKISEVVSK